MNRLLIGLSALVLTLSAAAQAATVYSFDYGRWHLKGYADVIDNGDNACVLSTEWSDGKKIQVNIFPKYDGSSNVTMTVLNPYWNFASWTINQQFNVPVDFISAQYDRSSLAGIAQVYSENKIIFRGLNATFVTNFVHYDTMYLLVNRNYLTVDLEGTAALAGDLANCMSTVLNTGDNGNH
jgi:hypothetical protein